MTEFLHGRSVLVVDEDPNSLRLLSKLLVAEGHRPVVAYGPEDAWRKLGRERFDVALIELAMKQESGIHLIERMRRSPQHASTPVLALTTPVRRSLARAFGCDGFVFRPIDAEELRRAVARA